MSIIPTQNASDEFTQCWICAMQHIEAMAKKSKMIDLPLGDKDANGHFPRNNNLTWLRNHLCPPFCEDFSFRLGNQLFFVMVVDVDGIVEGNSSLHRLLEFAANCKAHACLMPMKRLGATWLPAHTGWGLVSAHSLKEIDPPSLVTDEMIPMTPWEVHDFCVQIAKNSLHDAKKQLTSFQSYIGIDPTIWFIDNDVLCWLIVRGALYPKDMPTPPKNWPDIAKSCQHMSNVGYFLGISLWACNDPYCGILYRGYPAHAKVGELHALQAPFA